MPFMSGAAMQLNQLNQVENDVGADGTDGTKLASELSNLQSDQFVKDNQGLEDAVTNALKSLSDGTYSQEGTEEALKNAANSATKI